MVSTRMQSPKNGTVPNPDPTARTVEQMQIGLAAERAIAESNNRATQEILETRLHAMDKAIELLQQASDKLPSMIKYEVRQLRELHDEKHRSILTQSCTQFEGIATQFHERDKRTEQLSLADKTAIAAALQAQKEAAGATTEMVMAQSQKMDANFTKLIDQTQNLLQVGTRNTDEKINDLKSRIDRGEGVAGGTDRSANRTSSIISIVIAAAIAFAVVMTAIVSAVAYVVTR